VKGDPKVIAVLSEVLKAELTAINQYFLHAEMCENWGYERLAKHTRVESIEEMQHAEKLIEHILYLDGTPNMSDYFKINIGQNVKQQLEFDLQVEYDAVKRLNTGIETCVKAGDNGSRDLLEGILTDEEEHIDCARHGRQTKLTREDNSAPQRRFVNDKANSIAAAPTIAHPQVDELNPKMSVLPHSARCGPLQQVCVM